MWARLHHRDRFRGTLQQQMTLSSTTPSPETNLRRLYLCTQAVVDIWWNSMARQAGKYKSSLSQRSVLSITLYILSSPAVFQNHHLLFTWSFIYADDPTQAGDFELCNMTISPLYNCFYLIWQHFLLKHEWTIFLSWLTPCIITRLIYNYLGNHHENNIFSSQIVYNYFISIIKKRNRYHRFTFLVRDVKV